MASAPREKAMILNDGSVKTEILKGKWLQIRHDVRHWWQRMTDADVDLIQGDPERFIGKLQELYSYGREEAEMELNEFLNLPDRERCRWS
jgi:uncharacterized protein YjbJ (UPF0337 family)